MKSVESSGDVFIDLGFDEEEAANLQIRSSLMIEVIKYMRKHELSQTQAARLFGVTQPRISNLMKGKIHLFTIDMLVKMLWRVGLTVDLRVKKSKAA